MQSARRSSSVMGLLSRTLLLVAASGEAPASQPPAQVSSTVGTGKIDTRKSRRGTEVPLTMVTEITWR
jgi:hypothetical protein